MMPGFGLYQTGRLLLRSGRESFWVAKDASGHSCTLHVMELPEFWDDQQKIAATKEFLDAAEHQKTLADQTGAISKVSATGANERAAYAAMEPLEDSTESLERIISSRAKLSTIVLRKFTLQMLASLAALHKAQHAHGNLSAETLFLTSGNFSKAQPVLVAPSIHARQDDDLPALGSILFQLIQNRPYSAQSGIDAEGTEENWRIQEDGNAWKHLITTLLLPEENATVDSFRKTVPGGGRLPGWLKAAAALVLIAAVGGGAYWLMNQKHHGGAGPPPPDWLIGATDAADAVIKEPPPPVNDNNSPAAHVMAQLQAIAHEKTVTADSEATVKAALFTTLPAALDEISNQLKGEIPAGAAAAYPGYANLLHAMDTQAANIKEEVKKGTNQRTFQAPFESARQLAAISVQLADIKHKLDIAPLPEPQALQRAMLLVVDNDFQSRDLSSSADDTQLADILAALASPSQSFNIANDIVKQKSDVVWEAIKPDGYKPTYADLTRLDHDLPDFLKQSPTVLTKQAGTLVEGLNKKIDSLDALSKDLIADPSSDPAIRDRVNDTRKAYAKIADTLTADFGGALPGAPFAGKSGVFWIRRDYDTIKNTLNYANRDQLDAEFDLLVQDSNWLPKFLAEGPLENQYFTYYITMSADRLPSNPKDWTPDQLSLHHQRLRTDFDAAKLDFETLQANLQTLIGKLTTNISQTPSGVEHTLYDVVKTRLDGLQSQVKIRGVAYSPSDDPIGKSIKAQGDELTYGVYLNTLAQSLQAPTYDLKAINASLQSIQPLEESDQDAKLKAALAPVHELTSALNALNSAADPKAIDDARNKFVTIQWAPTPPNNTAFMAAVWNRLAEVKNAKEDLLQYEWTLAQTQIPSAPDARGKLDAATAFLDKKHFAPEAIANIMIEGVLPGVLKAPDPTKASPSTAELAGALEKINKDGIPRLTQLISALKIVPVVTIAPATTAGLAKHGWTETTKSTDDPRVFNIQAGDKKLELTFRKLANTQTYLCSLETPMSLLIGALNDDERDAIYRAVKKIRIDNFPDNQFNIVSPFQDGSKVFALGWGSGNPETSDMHRPKVNDPEWSVPTAPTLDHPLQFVTPAMSEYLALKCGCRLPTKAEWDIAYAMNGGTYDANSHLSGKGLNDYNQDYTTIFVGLDNSKTDDINPLNLSAGAKFGGFTPATLPPGWGSVRFPQKPSPKPNTDALIFQTVDSGPNVPFKNLIGNVAEFIFEENLSKTLSNDPQVGKMTSSAAKTADELKAGLDAISKDLDAAKIKVIGGSCLMPLGPLPSPYDPKKDNALLPMDVANTSMPYTDVGFRLAFDSSISTSKTFAELFAAATDKLPRDDLVHLIVQRSATP